MSISDEDKKYTVNFSPLTKNIAELNFAKEAERLHFEMESNKLVLRYSTDIDELAFNQLNYVVELKGTGVINSSKRNEPVIMQIEEKPKDQFLFNGIWIYSKYLHEAKK